MKRTVALALLGIAAASTAFGQGHVVLSNYVSPYNSPITGPDGLALTSANPYTFTVWYGAGVAAEGSLVAGETFNIDDAFTYDGGAGAGGWYNNVLQVVPTIETYSFQIRATGPGVDELASRSVIWQSGVVDVANPPLTNQEGFGLQVIIPEPTTFALAGLGAAALLIFRRRD
jgi:hypothetical protein